MRGISFLITVVLFLNVLSVASPAAEKRNQLEELLIWKMSEELKLSSAEEKKFSSIVKSMNMKKTDLNQALQKSVEQMNLEKKPKNPKTQDDELARYRKLTQNYGNIGVEEFDELKALLGTARMAQYLQVRQDLANRIKTMLSRPEAAKSGKVLPPPQLIEEM